MKTVLIVATVTLLCVQTLHVNAMPNGVTGQASTSESQAGSTKVISSSESSTSSTSSSIAGSPNSQVIVKTDKTTSTTSSNGGKIEEDKIEGGKIEGGHSGSTGVVTDGQIKIVTTTKTTSTSSSDDRKIESGNGGSTTVVKSSSGGHSELGSGVSHSDSAGGNATTTTTKTTITSSSKGDKTKDEDHDHFEITDEELALLDTEEIIRKSTNIHSSRRKDCEDQKKKLNNDNDNLTRQLKSANAAIKTLAEEKDWLLSQLEQCRDDNDGISNDFGTLSYEIRIVKKKLQKATDDYGRIQTELIKVSSESQSWKSKNEVCSVTLKQAQDINVKHEITVKESETTITTLQTTIEQFKGVNRNVSIELNEWKHKYDSEHTKVVAHEKTIENLEATIANLNKKNSELTENLSGCQGESHGYSVQIDALKTNINSVKKELSTCNVDNTHCSDALQSKIKKYNDDELQRMEKSLITGRLEVDLAECQSRYKKIEESYESEKALVLNCKNNTVVIREDCAKTFRQNEEDIKNLRITSKGFIDKCEASLKIQVAKNDETLSDVKGLKNRINDIELNLSMSIKAVEDANIKSKQHQDGTDALQKTIESLKITISNTTTQLTTCGQHSVSLQNELTECKSSVYQLTTKLNETEKILADNQSKEIIQLNGEIGTLKTDKNKCETELSTLRCDVNTFLEFIKARDDEANKAALEIVGIYDKSKSALLKFVDSHDIQHCDDCEECENCEDEILIKVN